MADIFTFTETQFFSTPEPLLLLSGLNIIVYMFIRTFFQQKE